MANRFIVKRNNTAGAVPSAGSAANQLLNGELGLNTADEKLYFINSLGQAVFFLSSNKTPSGGGGGGSSWVKVTINIPYASIDYYKEAISVPAVTAGSIVACQLVGGNSNAETEAEDMSDWSILATPENGSITFNIFSKGRFGGPVEVIYMVQ